MKIFSELIGKMKELLTVRPIIAIVILSLIVKLGYILALGGGLGTFPTEGSDGAFYDRAAHVLLSSGTYGIAPGEPVIGTPPGQAVFLAALYAVSNYSIAFAKLAHVGLLTMVAVLTFLTAEQLVGRSVGFWTGALIAIDPAQAYLSGTFLSEPLFIFLMVLGIYFLVRYRSQPANLWLVGAGVLFGLAGLTRNEGWLFCIVIWIGAFATRGWVLQIRAVTIVLLVTGAVILPWTYRNYLSTGALVPVSSNGGLNLWSGNNPEFRWRQLVPMSLPIYDRPAGLSELEADNYYRQQAVEWITSHPVEFATNAIDKVIVLYSFDPLSRRTDQANLYRFVGLFPYGILLPFVLVGLAINAGNEKFGIILGYILFTTLIAAVFFGDSRIRAPIQPYLYLFGVLGVLACNGWLQRWRSRHVAVSKKPGGEIG
jgi:4-amino-4-deoxy-L-arabinose transferase-like glycosyltransferase